MFAVTAETHPAFSFDLSSIVTGYLFYESMSIDFIDAQVKRDDAYIAGLEAEIKTATELYFDTTDDVREATANRQSAAAAGMHYKRLYWIGQEQTAKDARTDAWTECDNLEKRVKAARTMRDNLTGFVRLCAFADLPLEAFRLFGEYHRGADMQHSVELTEQERTVVYATRSDDDEDDGAGEDNDSRGQLVIPPTQTVRLTSGRVTFDSGPLLYTRESRDLSVALVNEPLPTTNSDRIRTVITPWFGSTFSRRWHWIRIRAFDFCFSLTARDDRMQPPKPTWDCLLVEHSVDEAVLWMALAYSTLMEESLSHAVVSLERRIAQYKAILRYNSTSTTATTADALPADTYPPLPSPNKRVRLEYPAVMRSSR